MATKPLVLVLGDSHVYWLERLVASEVDFAPGSFHGGLDCRIAFEGYRGGTVTTMEQNWGLARWHSRLARRTYKQYRLATGVAD